MRESYQKFRLSLNISWEPGSQVPRENAALLLGLGALTQHLFAFAAYDSLISHKELAQ